MEKKKQRGYREGEKQFVIFKIGDEEYGVEILQAREIVRYQKLTRVPNSPDFVLGVCNVRGQIIPIVDLRERFGLAGKPKEQERRIITVQVEEEIIGLLVDEVVEVVWLPVDNIEAPPPIAGGIEREYLKGVGKLDEQLIIILDLEKILTTNEVEEIKKMDSEEEGF